MILFILLNKTEKRKKNNGKAKNNLFSQEKCRKDPFIY
jgi:hypothetical protein